MRGLNFIQTKGEVSFFSDEKGNIYQKIDVGTPFKTGAELLYMGAKNGHTIKYNTDGVSGYSIFKDDELVKDKIWTLREADEKVISF